MELAEQGGYVNFAGLKTHQHPTVTIDRGIPIPKQPEMKPEAIYRMRQWYANKPHTETKKTDTIKIDQDTWTKRRVRDNQKGLKASEGIHGFDWYPVSNIKRPDSTDSKQIAGELYNINAATFKYGLAELPTGLGEGLSQGNKTLQRAPGDYFVTTSNVHNDQTIQDPGGIYSGVEGMKLK